MWRCEGGGEWPVLIGGGESLEERLVVVESVFFPLKIAVLD